MPPQDCFGSYDGDKLVEHLAPGDLAWDGEPTALVVVEQDAHFAEFLYENPVVRQKVLDGHLLSTVDPTGDDQDQALPWLQNEAPMSPDAGLVQKISIGHR
jgi:hypothetical protein